MVVADFEIFYYQVMTALQPAPIHVKKERGVLDEEFLMVKNFQ
jgi:hypothetical protein